MTIAKEKMIHTIINAFNMLDEISQREVVGKLGEIRSTTGYSKKAGKIYFRVVEGFDPRHNNGYCISGPFVKYSDLHSLPPGSLLVAVAKGQPKPTVMLGEYLLGSFTKFKYPSGKDGQVENFVSFINSDWPNIKEYLEARGTPKVEVDIEAIKAAEGTKT